MRLAMEIKFKNFFLINLRKKIVEGFEPFYFDMEDQSHLHQTHQEVIYRNKLNKDIPSHIYITVISNKFEGLSQLERTRLLNRLIKKEIDQLHAISYNLKTLEEYEQSYKP